MKKFFKVGMRLLHGNNGLEDITPKRKKIWQGVRIFRKSSEPKAKPAEPIVGVVSAEAEAVVTEKKGAGLKEAMRQRLESKKQEDAWLEEAKAAAPSKRDDRRQRLENGKKRYGGKA